MTTSDPVQVRAWLIGLAGVGLLLPALAHARTPLPTVEVVQPPKRLRMIDARMTLYVGAGYSRQYRSHVEVGGFDSTISFLQLTDATTLHLALSEAAVVAPNAKSSHKGSQDSAGEEGFLGADVGLGLMRVGPRKVALSVSVTGGPRWSSAWLDRNGVTPNGRGARVRAELFFRYTRLEDVFPRPVEEKWFRRYVLGGLHLWADARYDLVAGNGGPSWSAGIGLDAVRAVMLPIFDAIDRR